MDLCSSRCLARSRSHRVSHLLMDWVELTSFKVFCSRLKNVWTDENSAVGQDSATNQSQPKQGQWADGTPCSYLRKLGWSLISNFDNCALNSTSGVCMRSPLYSRSTTYAQIAASSARNDIEERSCTAMDEPRRIIDFSSRCCVILASSLLYGHHSAFHTTSWK